jgi:transcriptional regulator with XRE-family HTH domain
LLCNSTTAIFFGGLCHAGIVAEITTLFPPGNRLAEARVRAGLTQVQLARDTGVKQSSISSFETGVRPRMDAWAIHSLCKRLSITAEYLLDGNRGADSDEAEATALLRNADPALRAAAMAALRGMLGTQSRKQTGRNGQ